MQRHFAKKGNIVLTNPIEKNLLRVSFMEMKCRFTKCIQSKHLSIQLDIQRQG